MGGKRVLSAADVGKLLGWSTERARDWLIRNECGFKIGSRWFTTPTKIRDAFPEIYTEVLGDLEGDADDDDEA